MEMDRFVADYLLGGSGNSSNKLATPSYKESGPRDGKGTQGSKAADSAAYGSSTMSLRGTNCLQLCVRLSRQY